MSGGGGGGGTWRPDPAPPRSSQGEKGGSGGVGGGDDPCAISETTNLNSVDRAALASVSVGATLAVAYLPGPPRRLVAQTSVGTTVGSITSPSMPQFIQCIQAGNTYEAHVLSIRGALCQVEVRPV
jgi:hypothetical protein